MQSPTPPEPLTGHCSVIRNNTLYVYSPQAFQALPLRTNGTWSQLKSGVSVSGAACVGTEDTLWVVGGVPSQSDDAYTGLQSFTYATASWETITPVVKVTQNRQGHAAVLLAEPEMILIYGGSQLNRSIPTTQTFAISMQAPYAVQSFSARNIPVASPLLLPWDNSSAITLGSARNSTNVYRFQLDLGWRKIMPSIPTTLKSSDMQRATLIQGSDDSRVLELYDLSVSPNNISQIVLQNASGQPASSGRYIGQERSKKRKRALSLRDWPIYNETNAPTATRSGFALARGDNGLVAISGGGDASLALFNEQRNAWVNTTNFFGASSQQPLTPIPLPPSPSATESSAPQPPSNADDHHRTELILGATLGSILGFVALLIVLLLFLRWRRRRKAQQRLKQAEMEEEEEDEKDRLSFVDRGDPLAKEIGGIVYPASHASLSVHEGRVGHNVNHQRTETRGSQHSTSYLVPKGGNTFEMSPIGEKAPELPTSANRASQARTSLQVPGALTSPPRSSGWSRYFSGNDRMSVNTRNSTRSSTANGSERTATLVREPARPRAASKHSSSATSNHDCQSHGPTQLPPLDMGKRFAGDRTSAAGGAQEEDKRSSRISSMRESGETERPRTMGSSYSRQSTAPSIWSDIGRQEQTNWTPMTQTGSDTASRRTRDTTTSSFYGSATDSYYHSSKLYSSTAAPPSFSLTAPSSVQTGASGGADSVAEQGEDAHGAAKAIAVRVEQAPVAHQAQQATVQSDLSWLKIGASKP